MVSPACLRRVALLLLWVTSDALASAVAPSFDVERRLGSHWQDILRICPSRNYTSCASPPDTYVKTDAKLSQFSDFRFNGLGTWSTFTLATYDVVNAHRARGGDSWHIILRDPKQQIRVPARVFDEGNGNYTVAVVFLEPGDYNVFARLIYSDCMGYQEPWMSADAYMKVVTKADHCYISDVTTATHFAQVPSTTTGGMSACAAPAAAVAGAVAPDAGIVVRSERYMVMRNLTFHTVAACKQALPPMPRPTQRLILWGAESIKQHWEHLMAMARHPCVVGGHPGGPKLERGGHWLTWENFYPNFCPPTPSMAEADAALDAATRRCTAGAPWTTVPVGTNTRDVSQYHPDALLFDLSKFAYNDSFAQAQSLSPVPREFSLIYLNGWGQVSAAGLKEHLADVRAGDVVIINAGPHQQREQTFDQWRKYMDDVADVLRSAAQRSGAVAVWRSSPMAKEYIFRKKQWADGYVSGAHFNTDSRRLLFDSYAEHAMLKAGVHVWDVAGVSSVGGYKQYDMAQVDFWTIRAMNLDMLDLMCQAAPVPARAASP